LPLETLPSLAIAMKPYTERGSGHLLNGLTAALRALPVPIVGRIEDDALLLDLRSLEDVDGFIANLAMLKLDRPTTMPLQSAS
jgi:L-seryl-tRNA(Ser) seleniumtransferase